MLLSKYFVWSFTFLICFIQIISCTKSENKIKCIFSGNKKKKKRQLIRVKTWSNILLSCNSLYLCGKRVKEKRFHAKTITETLPSTLLGSTIVRHSDHFILRWTLSQFSISCFLCSITINSRKTLERTRFQRSAWALRGQMPSNYSFIVYMQGQGRSCVIYNTNGNFSSILLTTCSRAREYQFLDKMIKDQRETVFTRWIDWRRWGRSWLLVRD